MTSLTDEEILKLWHDPSFSGSFRGVRNFQTLLKTDLNQTVSEDRLLKILKTDTLFLIHQRPIKKFNRRKYNVSFYGQLTQIDIAFMFPDEETGEKSFLLLIDAFSFKIFAEPLKDKSAESVLKAIKIIFQDFHHEIYEVQSDRGKEFLNQIVKKFFAAKKVFLSLKYGKNKASLAEYGILLVKRKLYKLLRSELSHKWVKYLKVVVDSLNRTPLKRLGGLTPNDIHSEASSVFVAKARAKQNEPKLQFDTYKEKQSNQKLYRGKLNVGDYVYLDFDEKLFDKSFNVSVSKFQLKQFIA